ncbi:MULTISPECIES: SIR2 family protein [Methanobacterium]|uniref:Uncharacterized protein n=1 Tax=Methanobacterium bryantii TaxID=2161 RepID=A0A2A2H3Z6_METBR|nr:MULTISPECIES: SIR2 family protein [Methanobacterium]OEC86748.1 hypothetical protein A9507_09880 [Methanobacterium sp. A39]PAV04026.1 hypothetical protein ASJ80_03155 [Methanobacterium bryantii]
MKKNGYNASIEGKTFETYVTALLRALADKEKREFISQYSPENKWMIMDGYAPRGINDIEGPLAIEIKYSTQRSLIIKTINHLLEQMPDYNILIITPIKSKKTIRDIGPNVTIWDLNDIQDLGHKFSQIRYRFLDKVIPEVPDYILDSSYIWKIVDDSTKEAKYIELNTNKDNYMANIKKAYEDGNLVLFLGSGVSKPRLPNWKELIEKLIIELLAGHGEHIKSLDIDDNEFKSLPYITLGRYIKRGFGTKFAKKLKNALYEGYGHKEDLSSIINSIAELCVSKRIYSIVTYNYDDILEYYLDIKHVKYDEIYHSLQNPSSTSLPIYHVHGYIPLRGHLIDEMGNSIVFAEEEYHLQYKESFSWQNLKQLNLLKEKTVLFIGLGMNDPNLRRLLDLAKEFSPIGPKHYAILEDHWDSKVGEVSNIFRVREEDVFDDLRIGVIWYEYGKHSEIKEILDSISK